MTSRYHDQASFSSSGDDVSSYTQEEETQDDGLPPSSSPSRPAAKHQASVANSVSDMDHDEEYDTREIEILWGIILKTQESFANPPTNSKLPATDTAALFQVYGDAYEDGEVDTITDRHISKLLFKLGNQAYGETIVDRFKTLMAKLNLSLEIDGLPVEMNVVPCGPIEDAPSHHLSVSGSGRNENTYENKAEEETDYSVDDTDRRFQSSSPVNEHHCDLSQASTPPIPDSVLELSALAFSKHSSRFFALSSFHMWQTKSEYFRTTVEQIEAARDADLQESMQPFFEAWNALATRFKEFPPDKLPPNIYSERLAKMARRIYEKHVVKEALGLWRRRTRERGQRAPLRGHERVEIEEQDERLSKLAARAHENLVKSRLFSGWSNRVAVENARARIAMKAHEMGLKSRAFGLRPKLEELALSLKKRLHVDLIVEPTVDAPPKTIEAPLEIIESTLKTEETSEPEIDLLKTDQRTILARRHVLRVRFFNAWENYVANHVIKVNEFALKKALDPWRERVSGLADVGSQFSQEHNEQIARNALRSLSQGVLQAEEQRTKAQDAEYRNQLLGKLNPWLAASRERRKCLISQSQTLYQWSDQTNRDMVLEVYAKHMFIRLQLSRTLDKWRVAAAEAVARASQLRSWGVNADYYYRVTDVLRAWKGKAREVTGHRAMEREALEKWRECGSEERARLQEMENYASRADLYYNVTKVLPIWREAMADGVQRQKQLEEYGERADYYYKTRNALVTWRAKAKERRKTRLKEAHLEVRRIVKKGMGARCITQWRIQLQSSYEDYEIMSTALEEAIQDREWEATVTALDVWRARAAEKQEMKLLSGMTAEKMAYKKWQERSAYRREVQTEAQEQWQEKAVSKALKGWNLKSLQNESQRHTVAHVAEKRERRLLRHRFGAWQVHTLDSLESTQQPPDNNSQSMMSKMVQREQQRTEYTHSRGLLSAWRGQVASMQNNDDDEGPYVPTPGRPQLLLGGLGMQQTMTPLAPIPSRQWQGGPGDSILGGSMPAPAQGRASRPVRSRRNLRVSWAE